jgi:archaellum component FlaC
LKVINDNKTKAEKEKYSVQENKQIVDELEKTVKMIFNLKTYAFFVHMVLNEPLRTIDNTIVNESSLQDTLTRDKNIENFCAKLINELGRLDFELSGNIMENSNLTSKFNEMEENILKLMDKKHEIEKELKVIEEQFEDDIKVILD